MMKVIFDTDVGIDDAVALLLLEASPDVDLIGVVTGVGNASLAVTTRNALYLKERFGYNAPVFQGAAGCMAERLGEGVPDFVHGKNGLGDIDLVEPTLISEAMSGAEAIVALARQHPGEVSLVAVGRMTNVAQALALDPELPQLLKNIVIMGGAFGFNGHRGNVSPVTEANIGGDPLAADLVMGCGADVVVVGLDVTMETIVDQAFFERLRDNAGDAGKLIHESNQFYLNFHHSKSGVYECPVHDASAVAYLLRPELFVTQTAVVRVVTEGIAMGQTIHADPQPHYDIKAWHDRPTIQICTGVDAAGVREFIESILAVA
jgi:purine nucleosidase